MYKLAVGVDWQGNFDRNTVLDRDAAADEAGVDPAWIPEARGVIRFTWPIAPSALRIAPRSQRSRLRVLAARRLLWSDRSRNHLAAIRMIMMQGGVFGSVSNAESLIGSLP